MSGTFVLTNAATATATAGSASVRVTSATSGLVTAAVANEKPAPNQVLKQYNDELYVRRGGSKAVTYGTAAPSSDTWRSATASTTRPQAPAA